MASRADPVEEPWAEVSSAPFPFSIVVLSLSSDLVEKRSGGPIARRIRRPPSGDRVGIWRIVIVRPGRRSNRSRASAMVATSFTSVWPKRLPMQIREPPPKGT